jgi:hypothetical protein
VSLHLSCLPDMSNIILVWSFHLWLCCIAHDLRCCSHKYACLSDPCQEWVFSGSRKPWLSSNTLSRRCFNQYYPSYSKTCSMGHNISICCVIKENYSIKFVQSSVQPYCWLKARHLGSTLIGARGRDKSHEWVGTIELEYSIVYSIFNFSIKLLNFLCQETRDTCPAPPEKSRRPSWRMEKIE